MRPVHYVLCLGAGIFLAFLSEAVSSTDGAELRNGILKRNDCGEGEAVYSFYVEGIEDGEALVNLSLAERAMSKEELKEAMPEIAELLEERMLGENTSLSQVSSDLKLEQNLPEYGLRVSWESGSPEIVGNLGSVNTEGISENGEVVFLRALLSCGDFSEILEIPVTVIPKPETDFERYLRFVNEKAQEREESGVMELPLEFEGKKLTYRGEGTSDRIVLAALGGVAALCLAARERHEAEQKKKRRDEGLMMDYPDLVSRFLVLVRAGYPIRQAWKRQTEEAEKRRKPGFHPVYGEMRVTLNQMETGTSEGQAYGEFGRRCGLRCYVRFSSLLESGLRNGNRDLNRLLEEEMEEAFRQRKELARRRGEEASTRMLLPMFLLLGVVMTMVVAPALMTLG